jgi:hypothetical protein
MLAVLAAKESAGGGVGTTLRGQKAAGGNGNLAESFMSTLKERKGSR